MKKLPAWTRHFVTPLLITMFMSAIVSGIATIHATGVAGLADAWLGSWLWSWAVAYPALQIIMPIVHKMVTYIVVENGKTRV